MSLELSDEAKVAIELYLKETSEKTETARHQRAIRYTAFLALFSATIGALLAWTLTTVASGTRDAAVAAATAETRRLLTSDPVVNRINANLTRADDTAYRASQSAAEANLAAAAAEANLNTLRTDLARSQEVVSAVNKIGDLANAVANTPGFQDTVVTKVTHNIANLVNGTTGELQQLKQNLATWRAAARPQDNPYFFIRKAEAANADGSFNCAQGYYMIGVSFKNGDLYQLLCRPLADLAPPH